MADLKGQREGGEPALQASMYQTNPKFINGSTLLDDLSFSCHYHYTTANQLFHLVVFSYLLFAFTVPLAYISPKFGSFVPLAWTLPAVYASIFFAWDVPVALGFVSVASTAALAAPHLLLAFQSMSSLQALLWILIPALGLLVGHIVFEGSQPAFRAYEATVTTPFFCFLMLFFWLGYKPELRQAIFSRSEKWFGTERSTYNWGRHRELKDRAQTKAK